MKMLQFPCFDVIIVGARLDSIILARMLAEAGVRVLLTDAGSSLPSDYVQALQFTISHKTINELPELLRTVFAESGYPGRLNLMSLSIKTENYLLDTGVQLLYEVMPTGLLAFDGKCTGLVLGGAYGLASVPAAVVVDASDNGKLVAAMNGIKPGLPKEWSLTGVLAPVKNNLYNNPDLKERADDIMAEDCVKTSVKLDTCPPDLRLSRQGRRDYAAEKMAESAEKLGRRLERVASISLEHNMQIKTTSPIDGLISISPVDGVFEQVMACLADSTAAVNAESASVVWLVPDGITSKAMISELPVRLMVSDFQFTEPGVSVSEIAAPPLPEAGKVELVVVGGGTSGVPAAIKAAGLGVSTILIEKYMDLGGTNTIGGVAKYWFGRWTPYFSRYYRQLKTAVLQSQLPMPFVLRDLCTAEGVEVSTGTLCVGTFVEQHHTDSHVTGVVLLNEEGIRVVPASFAIDATGDGHLAAMSGVPYSYGAERDDMTYWASFGSFHHGSAVSSRQYHSVVDSRSARDVTRGIIAGRRQPGIFGTGSIPASGIVFREGRHIEGHSRLTYLDVLKKRVYSDGILVCHSNLDIKGVAASDAALLGFVEPDFLGEYDAVLPLGSITNPVVTNLIVSGRAHSASHDALSMARMQPDMVSLGAAAAHLVSTLLRSGDVTPEIRSFQDELVTAGIITNGDNKSFSAAGESVSFLEDEELELLIDRLVMGPLSLREQALILGAGGRAVPYLETALECATGKARSIAARMLAFTGRSSAIGSLIERLYELTDNGRILPFPSGNHHMVPDHGWMPEAVNIIYALGLVQAVESLPLLDVITSRFVFPNAAVDHHFSYAYAVSETAGRIAQHECLSILRRITLNERLNQAAVAGLSGSSWSRDPRWSSNPVDERYAYILLCAARAQTRCGDKDGALILVDFLSDSRLFLARSAMTALKEIVGVDHGFEQEAWKTEIEGRMLIPSPLSSRYD